VEDLNIVDSIILKRREIWLAGVEWIHLAQGMDR
jgi:hypothetical protein